MLSFFVRGPRISWKRPDLLEPPLIAFAVMIYFTAASRAGSADTARHAARPNTRAGGRRPRQTGVALSPPLSPEPSHIDGGGRYGTKRAACTPRRTAGRSRRGVRI